jgi:hypothetical protein
MRINLIWLTPTREIALLLVAGAVFFSFLHLRRGKSGTGKRGNGVDFHPNIGSAWQDGLKSVALLLTNKSDAHVWTEEIEISLRELAAEEQTSEASCREVHKIRHSVGPHDLLPVSLVETIYNAAGRPQRKYSCVMSSVVRFKVGENWFEEQLPAYRLRMLGLTVAGIRPERKSAGDLKNQDNLRALSPTSSRSK